MFILSYIFVAALLMRLLRAMLALAFFIYREESQSDADFGTHIVASIDVVVLNSSAGCLIVSSTMKFRALNFDYDAEAKLRLEEQKSNNPIILWLSPPSVVQEQRRLRKERAAAALVGDSCLVEQTANVNTSEEHCWSERCDDSSCNEKSSEPSKNDAVNKCDSSLSLSMEVRYLTPKNSVLSAVVLFVNSDVICCFSL